MTTYYRATSDGVAMYKLTDSDGEMNFIQFRAGDTFPGNHPVIASLCEKGTLDQMFEAGQYVFVPRRELTRDT